LYQYITNNSIDYFFLNITFGEITLCHNLDYESTPSESAGYDRNTKDRLVCFQEAPASTHTHIDPAM